MSLPKMKFLLDENVHRGLLSFIAKLGHDAKLSPKGIVNGKVFELALKEESILISRDSDFTDMPEFASSKHSGIILLRVRPRDLESQKRALSKLLEEFSKADEFKGKVIKILPDESFEFL